VGRAFSTEAEGREGAKDDAERPGASGAAAAVTGRREGAAARADPAKTWAKAVEAPGPGAATTSAATRDTAVTRRRRFIPMIIEESEGGAQGRWD
jgi:hypothetical protein